MLKDPKSISAQNICHEYGNDFFRHFNWSKYHFWNPWVPLPSLRASRARKTMILKLFLKLESPNRLEFSRQFLALHVSRVRHYFGTTRSVFEGVVLPPYKANVRQICTWRAVRRPLRQTVYNGFVKCGNRALAIQLSWRERKRKDR
jgi:hypothetical protein